MEHNGSNLVQTRIDKSLSNLLSTHNDENTTRSDSVRLDLLKKLSSFKYDNEINQKPRKISTRRKWIVVITVCVLIVSTAFGTYLYMGITYPDTTKNSPGLYLPSGAIVGKKSVGVKGVSYSYVLPENGSCLYFIEVERALQMYAWLDVTFYVGILITNYDDKIRIDKESEQRELQRLNDLGYHIGYAESWEYISPDEKIKYYYIAGYMTADELRNFPANENYGYSFYFATYGDGSPVDGGDGIIVEFPVAGRIA